MKYCYSNNGLSMRCVDDGYAKEDGEVLFESIPTDDELAEAFSSFQNEKKIEENKSEAKRLLEETDNTVLRISEAVSSGAITFTSADVVAFMAYRKELRSFITESKTDDLPVKPDYPEGT